MANKADLIAGASLQKNIGAKASLDTLATNADVIAGSSQDENVQASASLGTFIASASKEFKIKKYWNQSLS